MGVGPPFELSSCLANKLHLSEALVLPDGAGTETLLEYCIWRSSYSTGNSPFCDVGLLIAVSFPRVRSLGSLPVCDSETNLLRYEITKLLWGPTILATSLI